MTTCKDCGVEIEKRFRRCQKHIDERRAAICADRYSPKQGKIIDCVVCGDPLQQKNTNHLYHTECKIERDRMRYLARKVSPDVKYIKCAMCGHDAVMTSHNMKYCDNCRDKAYQVHAKERVVAAPVKKVKPEYPKGTIINTMFQHIPGSDARTEYLMDEIARRSRLPGYSARNPFPEVKR